MLGGISKIIKVITGKTDFGQNKKYIKLVGKEDIIKYDGNFHQVNGFVNEIFALDNKSYHVKYDFYGISGKDAGIYNSELKGNLGIFNIKGKDVTEKFEIEIVPGKLIIEKRNVTIKAASGNHEYDGKVYSLDSLEISGDGFINGDLENCSCVGNICIPGSVKNTVNYSLNKKVNENNYDIQVLDGELNIVDRSNPYELVLNYPEIIRTYSGTDIEVKHVEERDAEIDDVHYIIRNIEVVAKGKNVGEYEYNIYKKPIICNETGDDLSKQFSIIFKCGKLKIVPKKISLISNSGKKQYDGEALEVKEVLVEGLCLNDTLKYSIKGSQREVGVSDNIFEYHFEPDELKNNYIIEKKYGTLEVENPKEDKKTPILDLPPVEYILVDDSYKNIELKNIYLIDDSEYENKSIEELELSTRIMNRLQLLDVHSVSEMLNLTYGQLTELKGFGKSCVVGLDNTLRLLTTKDETASKTKKEITFSDATRNFLKDHMLELCHKEYDILDNLILNENEQQLVRRLRNALEVLDEQLILNIVESPENIFPVMNMLDALASKYEKKQKIRSQIQEKYAHISDIKRDCNIKWFVYAYSDDDSKRNRMLEKFHQKGINSLRDFTRVDLSEEAKLSEVIKFIEWCSFDVRKDINHMLENLYKNDREREVIANRAMGNTLDVTGKIYGVTRERIRQIEKKVLKRFEVLLNSSKIILKIFAERDGDEILTPSELGEYFEAGSEQILYLLRKTESAFYTYDSDLDVFVVGSSGLAERAQAYIDKLPEVFSEEKFEEIIKRGVEEYNLTKEIICAHIESEYNKTEKLYHRSRLTLQSIYDAILKKYYPNGLWVYGEKDISDFRRHIKEDYGNIILPENNRALVAQVCRAGILCGRGIYKAKQSKYLSNTLLKKIEKYIDTSDSTIFMMNTLFNVFEDELRSENVDNKYYLQGILHETFGEKWCFRRDYVSKDDKITSIYTEIVTYIKKAGYPVKKQEIQKKYPGITEIVLNLATNDSKILNLFGCYIHGDNLKLSKSDILYLKGVVDKFLDQKDSWHCRNLYEYIMENNSIILKRNYIKFSFGVYSLLEYYFRDEYNFSRPYIAKNGVEIVSTYEMIQEVVQASDTMEIAEISSFARNNYHQINNILGFLDSCNETHFLINSSEIASIDIIGITKEHVERIENILDKEVGTTMPISNLKCVHLFPTLNLPWTEWLIYSAIKRWGTRYEVRASEAQLKQSLALIAPKGKMQIDELENLAINDKLIIADDLKNIDDLIEDFELEELGLDEF